MSIFIPSLLSSKGESYIHKIKRIFSASLVAYYPMNEVSGTTAVDHSIYARDGTYTGVTLGQPGIGDGEPAALFSGGNGLELPAYWEGLNHFPEEEGSLMLWTKISRAIWEDGEFTNMAFFYNAMGGYFRISKWSAPWFIRLSTVTHNSDQYFMDTDWIHLAMTWSVSGNETIYYINGHPVDTDSAPADFLGYAWAHKFGYLFKGYLAHAILLNRPATPSEINLASRNRTVPKTITIIGDSIPTFATPTYPTWLYYQYNNGNNTIHNRAVGGHGIVVHFVSDCASASGDDADIILCHMGYNDNNAGNMSVLQAKVEEGLADLQTHNPDASIYFVNVLPCWTDSGGGTEIDKSNIRTAIAAGCAAEGVTCWDTYTDPWIESGDTSDGVHLTADGQEKVFLRIFPLIL